MEKVKLYQRSRKKRNLGEGEKVKHILVHESTAELVAKYRDALAEYTGKSVTFEQLIRWWAEGTRKIRPEVAKLVVEMEQQSATVEAQMLAIDVANFGTTPKKLKAARKKFAAAEPNEAKYEGLVVVNNDEEYPIVSDHFVLYAQVNDEQVSLEDAVADGWEIRNSVGDTLSYEEVQQWYIGQQLAVMQNLPETELSDDILKGYGRKG